MSAPFPSIESTTLGEARPGDLGYADFPQEMGVTNRRLCLVANGPTDDVPRLLYSGAEIPQVRSMRNTNLPVAVINLEWRFRPSISSIEWASSVRGASPGSIVVSGNRFLLSGLMDDGMTHLFLDCGSFLWLDEITAKKELQTPIWYSPEWSYEIIDERTGRAETLPAI